MPSRAHEWGSRRPEAEMSPRGRTLTVGGVLLTVLVAGLFVGFLVLGNGGDSSGSTATTPPVTPSSTPSDPRAQVEQAYLRAWDAWADALLKLDASGLHEAFTGHALQLITAQVAEQKRKSQPVRIRAEHNYTITLIDAQTASVDDRYTNHNVRLDPNLQPIEPDPDNPEHRSFTLKLVDGTWKIARIIEYR
jgi:hypothetical protein